MTFCFYKAEYKRLHITSKGMYEKFKRVGADPKNLKEVNMRNKNRREELKEKE